MQQFLPKLGLDGQPQWNTRLHGHIGNWRKDSVAFCLTTAIDLVRKIQYTDHQPSPVSFSFLFDDVITAKHDHVSVSSSLAYSGLYGIGGEQKPAFFGYMNKGEYIKGELTPAFQYDSGKWEEVEFFETADVYVMRHPVSNMSTPITSPNYTDLIVKAEDVDWSFEEQAGMREHYPHLFPTE